LIPFLLFLCSLLLTGCSSSGKVKVTGKVTINNQPLTKGTIVFVPTEEDAPGGGTAVIIDGEYSLTSTAPGSMKVYLVPPTVRGGPPARGGNPPSGTHGVPKDPDIPKDAASGKGPPTDLKLPKIPPKYLNANTSDYIVELKKGQQEINIDFK
jgi:hypothetical protein